MRVMPSLRLASHSSNSGMRLIVYMSIVISYSHFASMANAIVVKEYPLIDIKIDYLVINSELFGWVVKQ